MTLKVYSALAAVVLLLGGCVQNSTPDYTAPEQGDAGFLLGKNTRADELYVNGETQPGARDFRDVFIAQANLSSIQVIKPEGGAPDQDWQITDAERDILQKAIMTEFTSTLGFESAYNIVETREQSEITVNTTVVAIHPHSTREQVAAGAKPGGAITASISLVNSKTGAVMVRSVDTRSSDDIWAFNQVESEDPAIDLIFRNWGNSIRRGMLHLQGRSVDPLVQPVNLKAQ